MWLLSHIDDLLSVYGAIVLICSAIIKWTPSKKDDLVWMKVEKVLNLFSVVFTKEDAEAIASAAKRKEKTMACGKKKK